MRRALSVEAQDYERGAFEHYMLKEIFEQPEAIEATLRGRLDSRFATARLGGLNLSARELRAFRRVHIIAAGSALYAGLVGAGMLESLARLPASAEPAAEFRYRNPVIEPDTLYVAVSQSGETADTLAAVEEVVRKGGRVLGIVNVPGSSISRAVDGGIYLHAGPEISVTSTKAFTCMAVAFALLALHLGRLRDLGPADGQRLITALGDLPARAAETLLDHEHIAQLAIWLSSAQSAFFIGRVRGYPVALEGAQKLKEVSYIHAEAYPAAELKHGPLALVAPELPTVAIVPDDELFEKNLASLEQVRFRAVGAGAGGLARSPRRAGRPPDSGAKERAGARPDPARAAAAAARLPRGGRARARHRPAAQPGKERHGRVALCRRRLAAASPAGLAGALPAGARPCFSRRLSRWAPAACRPGSSPRCARPRAARAGRGAPARGRSPRAGRTR